jgi:hypothetical protein
LVNAHQHRRWTRSTSIFLLLIAPLALFCLYAASAQGSPRSGSQLSFQVLRAAAAARDADRSLVSDARVLKACLVKHAKHCRTSRRAVQRAGHRLANRELLLAKLARRGRRRASIARARTRAPRLSVLGEAVHWTRPGRVRTFVFARKVPGQPVQYSVVHGTWTVPPPVPGYTVSYSARTNVSGSAWSPSRSIAYAPATQSSASPGSSLATRPAGPATDPQTAPTIQVVGQVLTWTQIGGVSAYVLVRRVPGQEDQYSEIGGTSTTPAAVPGVTVHYAVRTAIEGSAWAPEVSISYPQSGSGGEGSGGGEPPPVQPVRGSRIIGTNDGAGWGPAAASTILAGHITWNRVEIGMDSNTLAQSLSDGFHVLAIVGNVGDSNPLSQVEPSAWAASVVSELQTNPGIEIAEAGNEMYLKGNIANPVQYGRMYLAATNAMKAAGIHTPLLFNMLGDYHLGTWSTPTGYSNDASGGGWLHDAVTGVPGLAAAILANGLSTHPYGALGENHNDTNGVSAVPAQEAVAKSVLGAIPPIYITEFGYSLDNCGENDGACSETEQATKMRSAYQTLLADPHVAGIWWYQSHDDSTGHFGYMNNDNTIRPAYTTLTQIATEQGQ